MQPCTLQRMLYCSRAAFERRTVKPMNLHFQHYPLSFYFCFISASSPRESVAVETSLTDRGNLLWWMH